MKKSILTVLAVAALILPSSANAVAFCSGTIAQTLTYANGIVMIRGSWRNDWTTICNLDQVRQGISSSTSFGWFSNVSSSIAENKQVIVYFSGLDQSDCATMATYASAPVPNYIMLIK